MPSVLAYHRPEILEEAISLAAQPNTIVIGGGTEAIPNVLENQNGNIEILDLQGLNLGDITVTRNNEGSQLSIGAMVRLSEVQENVEIPDLLRNLARKELPSALRNQATVGGTIALADKESIFLAGLLGFKAQIVINGQVQVSLEELLNGPQLEGIITSILIPIGQDEATSFRSVARTPMDTPIVSAIAVKFTNGQTRVVVTGIAETPEIIQEEKDLKSKTPRGDFRGSPEYRLHIANVLYQRVTAEVSE